MIAASVNVKALATYMGHASVTITYDRHGHLMPATRAKPPRCSTRTWRAPIHERVSRGATSR
jgi:hypothetical protein